jgi:hypothetical protein
MLKKKAYRLFESLAKNIHKAQVKTLSTICSCVTLAGRIRSFDIAHYLAQQTGVKNKSGLQRFYRFIHNKKFPDLKVWIELATELLKSVIKTNILPTISIDWTEWRFGLHVLAATVSIDRRAIPIFAQTFPKSDIPRSQNSRENTFVRLLQSHFPPVLSGHIAI